MSNSRTTYQSLVNRNEDSESAGGNVSMNSFSSRYSDSQDSEPRTADKLSIALIGPDNERRREVAGALAECPRAEVREFSSYPPALDDVPRLLEQYHDVILVDLDSNPEYAIKLVESICSQNSATVMVYSERAERDMVVRCMRAGAREFLTLPFEENTVPEALGRAARVLQSTAHPEKRTNGRTLVLLGAKGGSGVTTVACNLAVALAQESSQSTLLIDLGLPMGDAALNLGLVAEYSTDNALLDPSRLDPTFLSRLLVTHHSGLSVLAAPSKVPKVQASPDGIDKLLTIARRNFENIVVDLGSRLDLMDTALVKDADTIFLVTQAGISELRNSNRLISQFFHEDSQKLEVVINRYDPHAPGVTEEHIAKALTMPARWKIPDDYSSARQMQGATASEADADTPTSRLFRQMARSVCGLPSSTEKKPGSSFKNLNKNVAEKIATSEHAPAISSVKPAIAWATPTPIDYGTPLTIAQLNAEASVSGTFVYMPSAGYVLPIGTHTLWVTFTPEDSGNGAPAQAATSITVTKATPTISWPVPRVITSGTALGTTQLNAEASVPGTFVYRPGAGEVLSAGQHILSVEFTPADNTGYNPAQAEVELTVASATPTLAWSTPAPITCGVALSEAQLNATASVPGTFDYNPAAGEVLIAGRHVLSATFTPTDTAGYSTAKVRISLIVVAATPDLDWPPPAPMTYGTRLSAAQLNAKASVPGTFAYIPAEGSMLAAGTHTPSVIFTPADSDNYAPAQATVSLVVEKAAPAVTWPEPASINEGAPLDTAQLNATALVPGTFVYEPAAGETLPAGRHTLSATFTPRDTANYNPTQVSVSLEVTKTAPAAITWSDPAAISYGTPLSSAQLNAQASVPGTFIYIPDVGDVLPKGMHTLSVTFIPTDLEKSLTAQATATLVVDGSSNFNSLPNPVTHASITRDDAANYMDLADAEPVAIEACDTSAPKGSLETRTYKGATYEKGEDGQWHLQQK
jgi:Flp pilus assembly CpaE family ATPase